MLGIMVRGFEFEGCFFFVEIGQVLESLILENEEDYSQIEVLLGEYQYLLLWCWVNIKVFYYYMDKMDVKILCI